MSRFMFQDDDRERDLIGGTYEQTQLIYMTSNEVAILCGCSVCGARLVHDNHKIPGCAMVYPPGESKRTGIGTPYCKKCRPR